ncbi:hypothetical protein BJY52DRAFT_1298614 [Lactarius psammicola]|nr:hypothetical protein BJY52DRAFT_1298614 [Lactarius psammicola]
MASDPQGSTKNLSDSRAEALQALVSSLTPGGASSADTLSKEDVSKLSEKFKELLGGVDLPEGAMQRNERGEPLNEEGLPIIEITEPMESVPGPAPGPTAATAPIVDAEDTSFVPMYQLPPAERARNKAQMNRLLDMLEEEERLEEERNEARDRRQRREELEQRRANARAELERIKALKDMQKKMGKALLRNMADAREKEELEEARRVKEDLELEEARRSRKPRKSVSWAELPKSEKQSAGDDGDDTWEEAGPSHNKLPMRLDVVERFPTRPIGASSPPPPIADSDDESDHPSPDSDEGDDDLHSDMAPSPGPEPPLSDDTGDGDEDEPAEGHASEDEFDIDAVQHQREIALAYFEKRNKIGADAARAMSAHSHGPNDEDEWDREKVPLEATLSGTRPKPPQSKFKSERLAQAYGTYVPSTTPSTSLGTSVLPSSSSALRRAVHTGRLEDDQLVGNGDNDSEDEGKDDARVRAFMDALRRGDVTNAGAAENADALVAALESAYGGAPPRPPPATGGPRSEPATTPARQQKDSKFKLARPAAPPRTLVNDEGPREGTEARRSQPEPAARALPTSETVFERKLSSTARSPPPADATAGSPVPIIIDSPSFPPPLAEAGSTATIIDSPSFPPSRRPTRPPTVLPTSNLVRESQQQQQQSVEAPMSGPGPGKKMSRFKAQRNE